jgi:dipeptidyl aminopeptidase/acylaminoacyl peptidase
MRTFFSLFLLSILTGLSFIQAQPAMTIESMMAMKRVGEPVASPDGKWLCFTVDEVSISENKSFKDLYLLSTADNSIRKITDTPHNEWAPSFSADSKRIYFLSTESKEVQLWSKEINGSNTMQITAVSGGIGSYRIAGNTLAYTAEVKTGKTLADLHPDLPKADARVIDGLLYRHWDSWTDEFNSHVFISTIGDGAMVSTGTDIMPSEPWDAEGLCLSPDGKKLVYTAKKKTGKAWAISTNTEVYLFENGKTTNLSEGLPGYDQNPVFSPSGRLLVWESMAEDGYESDKASIIEYEFSTAKYRNLNPTFPESASNLCWSKDENMLWFLSGKEATVQVFSLDRKSGATQMLSAGDHDFHSLCLSGNTLYGIQTTLSRPNEIFALSLNDKSMKQVSFFNKEALEKIKLGKVEKNWVNTSDGKKMLVWHILPPDFDANKKYPAILYCQGGPQSMVSCNWSYRWNLQLLAAQGYIVVAPNRRGLPGFGEEWNDKIAGDWGGQSMKDYLSAIDDASTKTYVDKNRLGAVGASYGGYSVYWLAGNHNKRFKTFIAHCGLFNLDSWYPSTEEMFFANHDLEGPYWNPALKEKYAAFNPKNFVGNWDTPMLVIHGERDFRVPVSEGMQAYGVLQMKDIPSRFLYFPAEGHWVLKPQNSVLWHREFYRWLKETL